MIPVIPKPIKHAITESIRLSPCESEFPSHRAAAQITTPEKTRKLLKKDLRISSGTETEA
jgi:hypothetical protein